MRFLPGYSRPVPVVGLAALVAIVLTSCNGGSAGEGTPTRPANTPTPTATSLATSTSTAPPTATPSPVPSTPVATPTLLSPTAPVGFPLDTGTRVGWVDYAVAERPLQWGQGPTAAAFSRDYQPADDAAVANAGGWNCQVHVAFEGHPAVDWYLPVGTPVLATMDGTATLYVITTTNAFDFYDVARAPYVGLPMDGANRSPFPGPGGGKGVFVEVVNDAFATESAHFDLARTSPVVPEDAFLEGFSRDDDLVTRFAPMRSYLDSTPIARWQVQRGDLLGYSGDSGYSEAPHLHYTVRRVSGGGLLCPTDEPGFADSGWLFDEP